MICFTFPQKLIIGSMINNSYPKSVALIIAIPYNYDYMHSLGSLLYKQDMFQYKYVILFIKFNNPKQERNINLGDHGRIFRFD